MPYQPTTNFKDNNGIDLGTKLVTKDYLLTVYESVLESSVATGLTVSPGLWTWGRNYKGSLGVNSFTPRSTPVTTFLGGTNWKSCSAGTNHCMAIKTDGTLWTWGSNSYGQLGNNDAGSADAFARPTPITTFLGGTNWKSSSAGSSHSAAIKTDGTLWTWGDNTDGQLGTNSTLRRSTPVTTFLGGNNWRSISCGTNHIASIKTDGTLWTWGDNTDGQLGINNTTDRLTPVTTFLGGTNWKFVSCGRSHTSAIKTDGTLWTWGNNTYGELGDNTTTTRSTPVTTFLGGTNWKSVSSSFDHTASIKTDGTLWIWGRGDLGALGINNTSPKYTPVTTFRGGNDWKSVSCPHTGFHTTAIKVDGSLWIWGRNDFAQLGINNTTDQLTPVTTFLGGTNWKSCSAGSRFSATIRSNNEI